MPRKALDLIGQRFSKLVVISRDGSNARGQPLWKCKCDCGKVIIVEGRNLRMGLTKSCGCIETQKAKIKYRDLPQGLLKMRDVSDLCSSRIDPFQSLANAIIAEAADDYRVALVCKDEATLASLDDFFSSEWYGILTDLDPVALRESLEKEINLLRV